MSGKNVLFISSYSESFWTVNEQKEGIHSALDAQGVNLDVEYMDMKRFDYDINEDYFYNYLKI